jgi:periplasmic copper chaperone A
MFVFVTFNRCSYNLNMKKQISLLLLAAAAAFSTGSFAHEFKQGNITIGHPWARATPGAVKNSAAFMTLSAKDSADKLIGVSGDVAREIQIHTMITEAGVMKMREIKSLDIPANGKTELKPGGLHIMLIGLKDGLKEGEKFPLKLKFEKAGEVTVDVVAEKPGAHDHKH